MRTLLVTLAVCIALGCAAERPGAASRAEPSREQPPSDEPRADFTPPDRNGIGRAGGLVYLEEIAGHAQPADALPMLVLLHGRGDRPARGWLPLAPKRAVRVIMPQAPLPFGNGGYSWFPNRALSAIGPDGAALGEALAERADQLAAAIAILKRERPTVGLPLAGGFSQGGMLSFTLAARHPSAFRAFLPIAGLLPESLFVSEAAKAPAPLLALHGDADPLVPIDGARNAVRHLASIGYDAKLIEYPGVAHAITPAMLAEIGRWLDAQLGGL